MNVPVIPMKLSHHRQIMMKEVPKLDSCVSVTPKAMRKITKNVSCEFKLASVMSSYGGNRKTVFWPRRSRCNWFYIVSFIVVQFIISQFGPN